MKITYFGHSCFLVETAGHRLLFDPFIRPNELASSIDPSKIEADFILVSHGHEDHLADAAEIAQRTGAPIVSNWEIVSWFGKQGLENGHPMNHGGSWKFPFGSVKYVNAIHSSTLPDGSPGGNPGGFVIQSPEGAFYYAGDTALTRDMELIGSGFSLRFAVLPIGDNFTMGPEDAAIAATFVGVKKVIGVHYDTFPYIRINQADAKAAFGGKGVDLLLPAIGATVEL